MLYDVSLKKCWDAAAELCFVYQLCVLTRLNTTTLLTRLPRDVSQGWPRNLSRLGPL
jgi:hypothetical protein